MTDHERFVVEFNKIFGRPKLATNRAHEVWASLEIVSDALVGPLYSVLKSGHCDYVFSEGEDRFSGVTNADEFRSWASHIVDYYRSRVEEFEPATAAEMTDCGLLLSKAISMKAAAELAWRIQKAREQALI